MSTRQTKCLSAIFEKKNWFWVKTNDLNLRSLVETVSSDWLEVSVWSAASDWLEVSRQEPTPESSSDTEPRLPALSNFPLTTLDETKESGIDEVSLSGCEEITTISGRLSEAKCENKEKIELKLLKNHFLQSHFWRKWLLSLKLVNNYHTLKFMATGPINE